MKRDRQLNKISDPGHYFFIVLVFVLVIMHSLCAQDKLPVIQSHVTDLTNTLTSEQRSVLEKQLSDFEKTKGSQIIVVMIPTTGQEAIEQYAIRLADSVKVGRKGIDDGAILLIAKDDHAVRIEVGYGLEGALTDYASKRIIESQILPHFRTGDYYTGISRGVGAMIAVVQGEELPPPSGEKSSGKIPITGILPVLFIIGFFLRTIFGRILGGFLTGGAVFLVTWIALGALSMAILFSIISFVAIITGVNAGRGYRSGGFMMGGGGGFSDPFRGGGFGGGGGRFGGGGASGRW